MIKMNKTQSNGVSVKLDHEWNMSLQKLNSNLRYCFQPKPKPHAWAHTRWESGYKNTFQESSGNNCFYKYNFDIEIIINIEIRMELESFETVIMILLEVCNHDKTTRNIFNKI